MEEGRYNRLLVEKLHMTEDEKNQINRRLSPDIKRNKPLLSNKIEKEQRRSIQMSSQSEDSLKPNENANNHLETCNKEERESYIFNLRIFALSL